MATDWTEVAAQVIALGAPAIGAALGGPLGAAAGKVLADALGAQAAEPAAVGRSLADAVTADPEAARVAVQAAEAEWARTLAQIGAAQVGAVGETMRAEALSGDALQRWWRPLYAMELSMIECPAFALTLLRALWTGHEAGISGFVALSGLLIAYFGARFGVLGVYVAGRSKEKQCVATGVAAPSALTQMVKAVRRK